MLKMLSYVNIPIEPQKLTNHQYYYLLYLLLTYLPSIVFDLSVMPSFPNIPTITENMLNFQFLYIYLAKSQQTNCVIIKTILLKINRQD